SGWWPRTRARLSGHFFFQAEDGIRDFHVTGVQTCALPISGLDQDRRSARHLPLQQRYPAGRGRQGDHRLRCRAWLTLRRPERKRSEERRVGKECRSRGSRSTERKKVKQRVVEVDIIDHVDW